MTYYSINYNQPVFGRLGEQGPQGTKSNSGNVETVVDEAKVPNQELLDALQRLHLDGKYNDLVIRCRGAEYAVHKCIVCTRSNFFASALDGHFQESSTNTVILDDEEPALVNQMINYFYTLDYGVKHSEPIHSTTGTDVDTKPVSTSGSSVAGEQGTIEGRSEGSTVLWEPLSFHILMYSLADRMLINGLKTLARCKFQKELFQPFDSSTFRTAVMEIYNSTPAIDRGLRDLAVGFTMKNIKVLRSEGAQTPGWEDQALTNSLLKSVPQFAYDMLVATLDKAG